MNNEFSIAIRKKMAEKGLDQAKLAEKSGLTKMTIHNVLNGTFAPSGLTVGALSKALEIDFDELYKLSIK